MPEFTADEPISSMELILHTADVYDAGTNSDIYLELFDLQPGMPFPLVEIDTEGYDDFERNDTDTYVIPSWYYQSHIINDIVRVRLHKGDDGGSDWAFGWMTLRVNGKILLSNYVSDPGRAIWLSDGEKWTGAYNRVLFQPPLIENIGLPDADSNVPYEIRFKANLGRKPLKWTLTGSGDAFKAPPTFQHVNADGTEATFTAHTKPTATVTSWAGEITVTDAENRITKLPLSMRVIFELPDPKISSFTPRFGWAALPPAAPAATRVTINGTDFDSGKLTSTRVKFRAADGGLMKSGKVVGATSSKLEVEIPGGATRGKITVETDFGSVLSVEEFTAHANGYRFIDGFSFTNTKSIFPDSFEWERYEEAFGVRDMWLCDPILQVPIAPNPVATAFYLCTKGVISNGCCHGFSLTSLQMKHGLVPSTAFPSQDSAYPLKNTLWDLTGPTAPSQALNDVIQTRQLAVFSDEAMSFFLDKIDDIPNVNGNLCKMDARPALANVAVAIANQFNDPLFLAFCKNCSPADGHVVVPYNIENAGASQHIRCYDPNHPGVRDNPSGQNSYFAVNPNNGAWSYKGKSEVWDGFYMFTIPLSKVAVMGQSCGTRQAAEVSGDPRVTTTVLLNGAGQTGTRSTATPPTAPANAPTAAQNLMSALEKSARRYAPHAPSAALVGTMSSPAPPAPVTFHGPVAFINGGPSDSAYKGALAAFEALTNVPALLAFQEVGHYPATYREPNGGAFAVAVKRGCWGATEQKTGIRIQPGFWRR